MIIIPTLCPHCGTLFASRTFEESRCFIGLQIIGHQEPCPECNGYANTLDGLFIEMDSGTVGFRPLPLVDAELLTRFAELLQKAVRSEIDGSELERLSTNLGEDLGGLVRRFRSSFPDRSLLCILFWLKSSTGSPSLKMQVTQMIYQLRTRRRSAPRPFVNAPGQNYPGRVNGSVT